MGRVEQNFSDGQLGVALTVFVILGVTLLLVGWYRWMA
jgi:hypothetical protein